ncbi:MAG: cell envelope integrity protein CreD [Bacteroidia bacterium]|nr:cell envelope integrity protein CreD [Bacteroidia bacterium]NND25320.1 cell envelope integrity protein CreD [Flavobacteriaceae bacterium]MBT8279620.1 cell envelope integrity protein CreD [Bacteroidia bacterium]NNK59280.1 cell envelope integrity protein CreD [Flavobacteriaceae bacterium]NNL32264.1 cell envelope integrity protein CreD [Flavobacteriaceae bacterium]
MEQTENKNKFGHWIKTSITARMIMVGALVLILLIPLIYIEELIRERSNRQQEVVNEISEKWGKEVLIYGPVLRIPYISYLEKTVTDATTKKVTTETIEETNYAYFFPDSLDITTTINPEEKSRGIYTTAVYQSKMHMSGNFSKPDFSEMDIKDEEILWEKSKIIMQTSNLKGVNDLVSIHIGKSEYPFSSQYTGNNNQLINQVIMRDLISKSVSIEDLPKTSNKTFNINLNINGSKQISFIPIGKETRTQIKSDWKTANFFGEFLPYNDDKLNASGFDAKWKILDINRAFSQQHFNFLPDLRAFAFGVNFMIPVDEYQQSERSAKYGFLVISLTFLIFFLIQTLSKIPIHPFQYLMIGLALIMFYTLLVSISEHSNFLKAYLISGISVIILISLYSKSILKNVKFPLLIATSLTTLYAFIYVIIQLENYALLVGSIGLFVILSLVMYVSRKIDWNNG